MAGSSLREDVQGSRIRATIWRFSVMESKVSKYITGEVMPLSVLNTFKEVAHTMIVRVPQFGDDEGKVCWEGIVYTNDRIGIGAFRLLFCPSFRGLPYRPFETVAVGRLYASAFAHTVKELTKHRQCEEVTLSERWHEMRGMHSVKNTQAMEFLRILVTDIPEGKVEKVEEDLTRDD